MIFKKKVFKVIIISIFSIVCSCSFAQKLSLNQLILLKKNKIDYINDYLLNKGWEYHLSKKYDDHDMVIWDYDRDEYEREKAQAWLTIYFYDNGETLLVYECFNKSIYTSIKSEIGFNKMKKCNSEVNDNSIINHYIGANYAVSITFRKDNCNSYSFTLFSKDEYLNRTLIVKKPSPEQMGSLQEDSGESYDSDEESDGVKTLLKYIGEDTDSQTSRNLLQNTSFNTETKKIDYDNKSDFIDTPFDIPLRESPDINSKEIYSCPKNSKIQLLYGGNEAYQLISIDGHKGYVSRKFIKK